MFVRPAAMIIAAVASLSLVAPPATGAAGRSFRGHWPLNEVKGRTANDTSGHHHDGTSAHVVRDGSGYTFNGRNSRVIVPNGSILNPKAANFSFRVKLRMTDPPMPKESYDVLRKGLVTTKGGDYKLEIKNRQGAAVPRCVVRSIRSDGSSVLVAVQGKTTLADNKIHVVTCIKTKTRLTLKVDSRPAVRVRPNEGRLGSVSNASNLAMGAKAESDPTTGFDWFEGVIYDAWVASP
jgi:hypothetical protein